MALTAKKKIILSGVPIAWLHWIQPFVDLSPTDTDFAFNELCLDNLQSASYKMPKPGSDSGGEYIDINRADGAIWRFNKQTLYLDGVTEADITPPDSSAAATGKGEITIVINEAPISSNSWTSFIETLKTYQSYYWLVTIPTGYSYDSEADGTADGFVTILGKINSDLEGQLGSDPSPLSITFVTYDDSDLLCSPNTLEEYLENLTFTPIQVKKGVQGGSMTGPSIVPGAGGKAFTGLTAEKTAISAGEIVIHNKKTYS